MAKKGPRKIGEGSLQAAWRKGGKEIDTALNTGQAQIVQETGDFWNPPHAQIHKETGWARHEEMNKNLDTKAAGRDDLYGKSQEQEQDLEPEM